MISSETLLVEEMEWEGNAAMGETAFWLKILSVPATAELRRMKLDFKRKVYKIWNESLSCKVTVTIFSFELSAMRKEKDTFSFFFKASNGAEEYPFANRSTYNAFFNISNAGRKCIALCHL